MAWEERGSNLVARRRVLRRGVTFLSSVQVVPLPVGWLARSLPPLPPLEDDVTNFGEGWRIPGKPPRPLAPQ